MRLLCLLATLAAFGFACGDPAGDAVLVVRADGLAEARDGIDPDQTADGYAVELEHALVAFEGFYLRTQLGDEQPLPERSAVVELVPDGNEVFRFTGLEARRWDDVGFTTAPARSGATLEGADSQLYERMVTEGWSQLLIGTFISPSGDRIPFELGFPSTIAYSRCQSGRDGTDGVVLPVGGQAEAEITWHLTHVFFDSFAEDASLRVEPLAAVYDGESPVTLEQLRQQPLADIRGADGQPLEDELGNPVLYIPPPGGAETLREHVIAARFGHFDGLEGFCTTTQGPE